MKKWRKSATREVFDDNDGVDVSAELFMGQENDELWMDNVRC